MPVYYVKSIYENKIQKKKKQASTGKCFACFHHKVNAGNSLFSHKKINNNYIILMDDNHAKTKTIRIEADGHIFPLK